MSNQRIISYDILNVIACIAVVYLHQNSIVHTYTYHVGWFVALGVECICYFAVPVFFMLTGAKLMRYNEKYNTKDFLIKRIYKTLIPFILWSLIWLIIRIIDGTVEQSDLSLKNLIDGIINTKYQPIYWFFIPLFGIYALMPLLVLAKNHYKLIVYLCILFFITNSCYVLYCRLTMININGFIVNDIFGPLLYVLIGYYLSRIFITKKIYYILIICAILALLIRYIVTAYLSINSGTTALLLFGYYLPTAVFPSIALYLIIIRGNYSPKIKLYEKIAKLASTSYGVYLLHELIIGIENRIISNFGFSQSSPTWLLGMPILTYLICVIIVFSIKKIKIGNIIFP